MIKPLDLLNLDVQQQHETKEYRPQIVTILRNPEGKILLIQSAKNLAWWGFPQGGIDKGEDIESAIFRELKEELGAPSNALSVVKYCGVGQIAIPGWEQRDGFAIGKRYYYFLVDCQPFAVQLQPEEVSDYRWLEIGEIEPMLVGVDVEKRSMSLRFLQIAKTQESELDNLWNMKTTNPPFAKGGLVNFNILVGRVVGLLSHLEVNRPLAEVVVMD